MIRLPVLKPVALMCALFLVAGCGDNRSEAQRLADARLKIEQLSYRSAVIELRNVLRSNPKSLEARLALSEALDALGDVDAAEKEIERAIELGAKPDDYLDTLAHVYAGRRDYAGLLAEIDPSAVTSPALASELDALRANAMLALGSTEDAKAAFESVLAAGSSTEAQRVALLGLATIASSNADYARAEKLARQSLEIAPDSAESFLRVGQLLIVQTRFEDAIAFLAEDNTEGVRFNRMARFRLLGERAQAFLGADKLDEAEEAANAMAGIRSDHPMSGFLRGQVAYRRGDYDAAIEVMQAVAAKHPNFIPVQALLGAVSMQRGEFEQAEVYLSTAVAAQPDNASARQLLAETRMRMRRPEAAAQTLRDGLRNDQNNALLLAMLGRATVQLGSDDEGIEFLQRSLAAQPDNPQAAISLAAAYVAQGRQEEAAKLVDSLPEGLINESRRQVLMVVARYDENDPSAAKAKLDELLAASPDDVAIQALAGSFYLSSGDNDAARAAFEKVLTLDPGNRNALTGMLRVDEQVGDFGRSRELFTKALEADPNNEYALLVLARIAEAGGNHERAIELISRAHSANSRALLPNIFLASDGLRTGNIDVAERHARLALTNHEDSAQAQAAIGLVYLRKRQFQEALPHFKRAAEIDPNNFFYFYQLGGAQVGVGQLAQARESFREAFRLNNAHLPSLRSLAVLEVRAGNSQRADQLVRIARDRLGDTASVDELTGDVRNAQDKYSEALLSYNKAYDVEASWSLARKIFNVRQKVGTPDATQPLRSWLNGNPEHIPARVLLAQTYHRNNDAAKAIEQYEMLIVQQPDSAFALNNLAWLYFEQEGGSNRERALEIAERAHRLAPRNVDIADTLGWIQFNSGRVNEALETLRGAMANTTPQRSPDIAYHLSAVLHETGASQEAEETLRRALASTRRFEKRDDAQALFDSL